jgi:hypothetical protein
MGFVAHVLRHRERGLACSILFTLPVTLVKSTVKLMRRGELVRDVSARTRQGFGLYFGTPRATNYPNWFRRCFPVGIKLKLNDQFLFSGSWRILPLLNRLHGGLSEDRTAAQQLGALDCSAWLNHNFDAHDSPDIEPL